MPIMPHIHLAADTPDWVRYGIIITMVAYAAFMLVGAYGMWRRGL